MAKRQYSAVTLDIQQQALNEVDKKIIAIATIKSTGHDPTPDDSDDEDKTIPLPKCPTLSEAIDICTLSHNLEGISNTEEYFPYVQSMQTMATRFQISCKHQTSMSHFIL